MGREILTRPYRPAISQADVTSLLRDDLTNAVQRLYSYLLDSHWDGEALVGPDPGVRFNARIWRFLKSYTRWVPWNDEMAYIQAQKYWISCNSLLSKTSLADAARCEEIAVECGHYLLGAQYPDGHWAHPNKEWSGRIATVEGNYGAMGLIEAYQLSAEQPLLDGATRWYDYATDVIGLKRGDGLAAINYFANMGTGSVPNVTVSALRTFALIAKATGDDRYLADRADMVRWLKQVQLAGGELPYAVADLTGRNPIDKVHFLCYQYNAFELLNATVYYELTADSEIWNLMEGLARFVAEGVTDEGACRYDCSHDRPEVSYYTAAAAGALTRATELGIGDYGSLAERCYRRVLSQQERDGSVGFYSRGNYGFLTDRRSYPRYLAMTLYLLMIGAGIRTAEG